MTNSDIRNSDTTVTESAETGVHEKYEEALKLIAEKEKFISLLQQGYDAAIEQVKKIPELEKKIEIAEFAQREAQQEIQKLSQIIVEERKKAKRAEKSAELKINRAVQMEKIDAEKAAKAAADEISRLKDEISELKARA